MAVAQDPPQRSTGELSSFQISTVKLREAKILALVPTQMVELGLSLYCLTAKLFLFLLCCLNRFKARRYHCGMEQGGKFSWKR